VNRSRRQRGGANESLAQGAQFAKFHVSQHGGSRDPLMGAPLDYTGVLDSSMRGAARLSSYDAHFAAAQAQSGGSRRRQSRRRQSRRRQSRSRQSRRRQSRRRQSRRRQSRSRQSRRRQQRGGGMSPADVSHPYTLLGGGEGAPAAVGERMHSPSSMKGGRRSSRNRRQNRKIKKRNNRSRRQRGGYSPIGNPSMLLASSEYDKAGLHGDFKDPLLRH